jgi:hypothetical protein
MRNLFKGLCLIGVLLLAAIPALAQDATEMMPTPTFIPTPVGDPAFGYPPPMGELPTLGDISFKNNICLEDLVTANRDIIPQDALYQIESQKFIRYALWVAISVPLTIPDHEDCYEVVKASIPELPRVEKDYNVCVEELYDYVKNGLEVYVRKNAPACVNDMGQRLQYYASEGQPYDAPIYSDVPFVDGPADITQLGYCVRDLIRANPIIYFNIPNKFDSGDIGYISGMRVFVPEGASHCATVPPMSGSLYKISQQENICMETMLLTSGLKLMWSSSDSNYEIPLQYPLSAAPCYDGSGQRNGFKDREVYTPQIGESFLDIARAHDVCLDDLWNANPVMETWDGWTYVLPPVVFIPNTDACDQQQYTVHANQTWHAVSLLTNTCINRLADANRTVNSAWLEVIPEGTTLTIPQRPHCYDLADSMSGLKMRTYICYSVPVTAESDFTGHKPAISGSLDTDLPYCYDRNQGMTIFHNNAPYTLYNMRGYESFLVVSQCFGVKPEALLTLNLYDRFNSAWSVSSGSLNTTYQGPLLVPQPHADCSLLVDDPSTHWQRYVEMTYKAGSLQDGIYIVNYGDTLSSIGHKYGYLPQSIADENGLPNPNVLYYLQELKLPTHPSLYTLAPVGAAAGGLVLAGGLFIGLRRWSSRRGKSKKKNS